MAAISKELVEKYESEGKRIIRIAPDWGVIWEDTEGMCHDFEEDGSIEICSEEDDSIVEFKINIPGFCDWLLELHEPMIAINIGEEVCFDFEWWNERGLEYAQQLREALPDKYVLFYEYAAEDLLNRWKPAVLIEKK